MIVMTTSDALQSLDRELREIFGPRLQSLVAYGSLESRHSVDGHSHGHGAAAPARTLAIVDAMTDLGPPEEIRLVFSGFQKFLYQAAAT